MVDHAHIIVLVQFEQDRATRTYVDYRSMEAALDGVCHLYERCLKIANPSLKTITYDISDLFCWVDSLGDLCCLVFSPQSNSYVPHNKEWIKARVFEHLQKQAIP
mmetsp:Transcript_8202/g.18355  ORF Transcript_8202/g.18355 Transcript_8202/m.18355 type:complete len:105 (+) Transcript_8202:142-456(+)